MGHCPTCESYFCKNNGTCIVNESNCTFQCLCTEDFNGSKCDNIVLDTTRQSTEYTTTLRPVSKRSCMFGMITCVHGFCQNGMKCSCDKHWAGAMCEKLNCPLACNSACKLDKNTVVCIHETTNAEIDTPAMLIQKSTEQTVTVTGVMKKNCPGGDKVCVNGYCDRDELNCICDYLWLGTFCDQPDCLAANCSSGCQVIEGSIKCLQTTSVTTTGKVFPATREVKQNSTGQENVSWTLEEKTCLPGFFVCDHGYCKKENIRFYCVCDPFWSGMFCDNPDCPHCSDGCKIQDGLVKCKNVKETTLTTVSNISSFIVDDLVISTTIGPVNGTFPDGHACSENYTYTDDFCFGIPCKYGQCKYIDSQPGSMKMQCSCDPGATGQTCQSKCCKICEQGLCKIDNNGTEFCNCLYGYEGEFCELKTKGEVIC